MLPHGTHPRSRNGLLQARAAERFFPQTSAQRIRRTTALVLGGGIIVALTIPGAGWYAITVAMPLYLAVGMVVGYTVIAWFVKQSASLSSDSDQS